MNENLNFNVLRGMSYEDARRLDERAEEINLYDLASTEEIEDLRAQSRRVGLNEGFLKSTALIYLELPDDDPRKQLSFPDFVEEVTLDLMTG